MCEICRQNPCHMRCPNYRYKDPLYYCSICGEEIYEDEEYIENLDGECVHYDCVKGIRWLLDWLGYDVKMMENG